MIEVGLIVGAGPAMVQVRGDASPRIVEGKDGVAVIVDIGIKAGKIPGAIHGAGEAINAAVVVPGAALAIVAIAVAVLAGPRRVVRATRRISQRAEIIVERMVFLHNDD